LRNVTAEEVHKMYWDVDGDGIEKAWVRAWRNWEVWWWRKYDMNLDLNLKGEKGLH
jgi:hypothetical protein